MREDVEPWAQPSPLSPPCPSIPSCGQRGLPAPGPASVLLLCSFHVNLFIDPAPKTVSDLPGGAVCGEGSLASGGALGWCCIPGALSPSCTQLLFLLALRLPRVLGWAGGNGTGQLGHPTQGASWPDTDCEVFYREKISHEALLARCTRSCAAMTADCAGALRLTLCPTSPRLTLSPAHPAPRGGQSGSSAQHIPGQARVAPGSAASSLPINQRWHWAVLPEAGAEFMGRGLGWGALNEGGRLEQIPPAPGVALGVSLVVL